MQSSSHDVESTARNWVWVPNKSQVFRKGYIVEELDQSKVKVRYEDNSDEIIEDSKVEKVNPAKFDKADDMAELTFLNEPSVLHNLETRYKSDLIYTYSGLFLVAVNPYSKLQIYGEDYIKMYNNSPKEDNRPHIFAEAEETYRDMLKEKRDQSILVTGESGAGKTENTKKIIQYLAAITSNNDTDSQSFEQQIIQANPILESFGNAQTVRNNNSSRFGKFIKIEFDDKGKISGAHIDWYLLEKSRVVKQSSQERNYHIFYQLLEGLSSKELELLGLTKSAADYQYLKEGNSTIPGVDDKKEFKSLTHALDIVGISKESYYEIFKLMASILHLGNIEFTSEKADQASFKTSIETLCGLLEVDTKDFREAILRPKVKAGKEVMKKSQNASQARFSLDALAKSLYEKVFKFLVDSINDNLNNTSTCENFIGVLDIAGFEIFKKNSFEQLCINYTNEKLQQFFNHHMFVLEQQEYIKEDIDWKFIDFGQDLQQTIDLIEKSKPLGILSVLDEECIVPKSTNKSFFDKLSQYCSTKSPKFKTSKFGNKFTLKHYAGDVDYSTDGWVEKNRDPLNENIIEILSKSSSKFISSLYRSSGDRKSSTFRTVAQRHKEQLSDLMTQLSNTSPHFVRCIIPNNKKKPQIFDRNLVLEQLKCNGVLEGIRIVRSGFPNRSFFKEFFDRYQILSDNCVFTSSLKNNCANILTCIKLDPDVYKVGASKIFFKAGVLNELEVRRDQKIKDILTSFNAIIRGQLSRKTVGKKIQKLQAGQVLAKTFKTYNKLCKNPWYLLYLEMKPLLSSTNEVSKSKQIGEQIKNLEKKLSLLEVEKSEISTKQLSSEQELLNLNTILETERSLLKEKEEILNASKKREEELEQKLNTTMKNISELESQRDDFKKSKEDLDEKLKLYETNLEKGKQLINVLEKEKVLLNGKIKDLENALKKEQESQKSYEKDTATIKEELKMLKKLLLSKEKLISDLQSKILDSETTLEAKITEITSNYKSANRKLKELVDENKELNTKLKTLKDSSQQYENVVSNKESDLRHLQGQLKTKSDQILAMERERDSFKKEHLNVSTELHNVRSDVLTLKDRHKQLEHEAKEARELLQRKITDEIKFDRGKQQYDTRISSLEGEVDGLRSDLTQEKLKSSDLLKEIRTLKSENEEIQMSRKESGYMAAQSSLSALQTRSLNFNASLDADIKRLQEEKNQLLQEYSHIKLQLNEQSAILKKETIEKTKLKTDLKLLHTRLASEAFDKQQLQIQLKKIKETLCNNLSPLQYDESYEHLKSENDKLQSQIHKLKTDLEIERKTSERAAELSTDLQRKIKNSAETLCVTSNSDENQFKARYEASEARIRLLERQLMDRAKNLTLKDTTNVINAGVESPSKEVTQKYQNATQSLNLAKKELIVTKDTIAGLQKELLASKETINNYKSIEYKSLSSDLVKEELTKLQLRLDATQTKNSDLSNSLELYKNRSEDYFSKLENAEAAIRTAKHAEKFTMQRLQEAEDTIKKLNSENRLSDKAIAKLHVTINQLKQELEDKRSEISKAETSNLLIREELNHCRERLLSTAASEKYESEIKKLNDSLVRSMRNETDLRKSIGSLELELETLQRKEHHEVKKLTKEKTYYLKMANELEEKNEKATQSQRDLEIKLRSLLKQIGSLNSSVDSLIKERDSLQDDKKRLEIQIKDLSSEYSKFANERDLAKSVEKALREDIEKSEYEIEALKTSNKRTESLQEQLHLNIEEEKQKNMITLEENKTLARFNEQMKERINELQQRLVINNDQVWMDRNEKIESRLQDETNKKLEAKKNIKMLELSVDDLKNQLDRQAVQLTRYSDDKSKDEFKISELLDSVNKWQNVDASNKLSLKRAEREIRHLQEHSLELEKELGEWKERFQTISNRRKAVLSDDVFI